MTITFYLLLLGLGIYEIVALVRPEPNDTISEHVWKASRRPLVPFLLGMLAGHFFWTRGI